MEHLLGITGLTIVALITLYLALRHPAVRIVLLVAFMVRAGAALFHFYVAPLPDGTSDAVSFERTAWEWASKGLPGVLDEFRGPHSYFISFIIGIVYAVTDRSPLLAQSLSVLCGMGSVFLGWKLTGEIWGKEAALKAAWVTALFPTLVLYSALTMREAYIWFFLLLGLICVVRWARNGGLWPAAGAVGAFIGATFFHGAMLVAVLAFLGLVAIKAAQRKLAALSRRRLPVFSILTGAAAAVLLAGYVFSDISVPKLGTFEQAVNTERIMDRIERTTKDTAAYPEWTVPQTTHEILWKAPIRAGYFMFSPFPWDISNPRHVIGLFDGMLYLVLAVLLWRNRKMIWSDPGSRSVLIIVGALIVVFGVAIGNFGAGLRHRAKFAAALIALAAPRLPRFVVRRKRLPVQPVRLPVQN